MSLEMLRSLKSRHDNTIIQSYLKIFLKRQICAVGWEPNPATTEYLKKLEASYERCGFRVKINTETGVGIQNAELKFVRMSQVYIIIQLQERILNVKLQMTSSILIPAGSTYI